MMNTADTAAARPTRACFARRDRPARQGSSIAPFVIGLVLGLGCAVPSVLAASGAALAEAPVVESLPGAPAVDNPAVDKAVQALVQTMQMADIITVMREEGLDYAATLEQDMFPGRGGAAWRAEVATIYGADRMQAEFLTAFADALTRDADIAAMADFMASDLGQRILGLELSARRAMIDKAVEEAARVAWLDMEQNEAPRSRQIDDFAQVNDLMESNVTGAMNANLAFYRGMTSVAPKELAMAEADILIAVADQEAQIRADTADWLFPYLALAYQPLTDDEVGAYIEFSESDAGTDLNRALFSAFAVMFDRISFDLGAAAGRRLQGQDI